MHWFRNSFELVQLRQILEASCGYAIKFGLVRQERDWKSKQAWYVLWTPKTVLSVMPCRLTTQDHEGIVYPKDMAEGLEGFYSL